MRHFISSCLAVLIMGCMIFGPGPDPARPPKVEHDVPILRRLFILNYIPGAEDFRPGNSLGLVRWDYMGSGDKIDLRGRGLDTFRIPVEVRSLRLRWQVLLDTNNLRSVPENLRLFGVTPWLRGNHICDSPPGPDVLWLDTLAYNQRWRESQICP